MQTQEKENEDEKEELHKSEEQAPTITEETQQKKKGVIKRNFMNQRRLTTQPKMEKLDTYYSNDRVLQLKEHILELKKQNDPEKELILQRIEDNIKKTLKQHFRKKLIRKKINGFTGDLQSNQDIKMINIFDNNQEAGPSIDYQELNDDLATGSQDLQPNFNFNDFSILDDIDFETGEWNNDEGKRIFAMIQKQLKSAKIK